MQCPKGTFYNVTKSRCQSCPLGFYNDALGKSQCKQCPPNHSTRKLHTKKRQDCKGLVKFYTYLTNKNYKLFLLFMPGFGIKPTTYFF